MVNQLSAQGRGNKKQQEKNMDTVLLNGRFTSEEAEQLFSQLNKVKTDFHFAKIATVNLSEEERAHSEKRVLELENELTRIVTILKDGSYKHVAIKAKLSLEFCPDYHNV